MRRETQSQSSKFVRRAAYPILGLFLSIAPAHPTEKPAIYAFSGRSSKATIKTVQLMGLRSGLVNPVIYSQQSFTLIEDGMTVGDFVVGSGTKSKQQISVETICFVAYVPRSGVAPILLRTIGAGDWEAETCTGVKAVGIVNEAGERDPSIGILFEAQTPNADVVEPVVLTLTDNGTLKIDSKATHAASSAGVEELRALKKVISK